MQNLQLPVFEDFVWRHNDQVVQAVKTGGGNILSSRARSHVEVSRSVPRVSCRQANVSHIEQLRVPGVSVDRPVSAVSEQENEHAVKIYSTVVSSGPLLVVLVYYRCVQFTG